jgi:hypothetical protein
MCIETGGGGGGEPFFRGAMSTDHCVGVNLFKTLWTIYSCLDSSTAGTGSIF